MLFLKLSTIVFLTISFNLFATEAGVDYKGCLNTDISTKIDHSGKFWGLIKHNLEIEKSKCVMKIHHKKLFSNNWEIDVCRQPVHIKIVSSGIEVLKKDGECPQNLAPTAKRSDYCKELDKIILAIQDDGLIFAEGEKENLSTSHGQIFCVYALLKKYLLDGFVMSRREDFDWSKGVESIKPLESCDITPPIKEVIEEKKSEIIIAPPVIEENEQPAKDNKKVEGKLI